MNPPSQTPPAGQAGTGLARRRFKGWIPGLLAGLALSCGASVSAAAYKIYVQIETLQGESADAGYENWIPAFTFRHAVQVVGTIHGGTTAPRPEFDALEFTKALDRTTPKLNRYCAEVKHLDKATLVVTLPRPTGPAFRLYEIQLEDVVITRVEIEGNPGSGESRPVETVQLRFAKIRWIYESPEHGGKVEEEWDLEEQRPG